MANVNARRVEEILTSGITAGHYVAGSNITITENQDGTETIASTGGGGGGTTDYSDLTNKPSINNVTLSGNKTTSDLGIDEVPDVTSSDDGKILKASYSGSTGTYGWGNLSSTDVTNVLSSAQQNAINSGITSNKVSNYDTIVGQMETFYPTRIDIGENVGEITAQDLDNLHSGIYEYLVTFTGSGLPTELANKKGVVRGYFTQGTGWNANFQMVETTDGIFGVRTYDKVTPQISRWSDWAFNVPATAPTEYTTPTYDSSYVDTQQTSGGYVIDNNNICTVNIAVKFSSDGRGEAIASGLPSPAFGSLTVSASVHNTDINKDPGFFTFAYGDLYFDSTNSINMNEFYYLNVSYLVDTST